MLSPPLEAAPRAAAPSVVAPTRRFEFIDAAKAIGIVLVVLGHAPGRPDAVATLIYGFHMPLFFFISGYLLSPQRADGPLRMAIARSARSLLTPYAFFFAVSLAYWLATRHLGARAAKFAHVEPADALHGFVTGLSSDLFINVALWFFPCMFVVQVLYAAVRRVLPPASAALVLGGFAVVLLALTQPWTLRWPWGLDIAWIAIAFYAVGQWWRASSAASGAPGGLSGAWLRRPDAVGAALVVALAAAWLLLTESQGRVDLAQANFGNMPLLYIPCAAAGILVVLAVAHRLPASRALRWLSDNSLVIFPLHPLLINAASGVAKSLGAGPYGPGAWLLLSLWSIAACVPIAWLLRRYLPLALGLSAASAARRIP